MKTKSFYWLVVVLSFFMLATLGACNGGGSQTPDTFNDDGDWRNDVIYFAMTDRFANGDPSNDDGAARGCVMRGGEEVCYYDEADVDNPVAWHGGDFAGLIEKLEEGYFTDLGVTAIWISPVVLQAPGIVVDPSSPNEGLGFGGFHGYWAEDFKQVDPHFGTLDEYKQLIEVAHDNDIKIIQDMVLNHTGYNVPLVFEKPEWFNGEETCSEAPSDLKDIRCALVGLPDFDQRQDEVVAFLNDVASYWVDEVGIDGIRMDTIKHVEDSYWEQFFGTGDPGDSGEVWTVGEGFYGRDNAALELSRYLNDFEFPSVFDFQLHWGLNDALSSAEGSLDALAQVFDQDTLYDDPSRLTTFVDNHDVPRFVTVSIDSGASEAEARERLEMALGVIFTSRGTPSFYYGTEIAMQGKGDNYNYVLGEGNREDMRFDEVAGSSTADWLKTLADARQAYPALTEGTQRVLVRPSEVGANVMAYSRTLEGEAPIVVVINNQNEALDLGTLEAGALSLAGTFAAGSSLTELLGQENNLSVNAEGNLTGTLPARSLFALSAETGQAATAVTFRVDARSQGEAQIDLRRFDTGTQIIYPMTSVEGEAGFWETTLELTPGTELDYKFGNSASGAKGGGYEGSGQDNRSYTVPEDAATVEATYDFIDLPAPESSVQGTVTDSNNEAIAGATVQAQDLDTSAYYALTNSDGSYYLPMPAGESSAVIASAGGFAASEPVTATAGDTGVDFVLEEEVFDAKATLQDPDEGDFGAGNNFQTLEVTWDDASLTVRATFTASGNTGIVYMDYEPGGVNDANTLNAWPRLATFPNNGIDAFFARFGGDPAAKAYLIEDGSAQEVEVEQTVSDGDSLVVTLTFPWETLGFEGKPVGSSIGFFAGVFGGDNYGAGDIAPDESSTPSANNSTTGADPFPATFSEPFSVTID